MSPFLQSKKRYHSIVAYLAGLEVKEGNMRTFLFVIVVLLAACDVTKTSNYNIAVDKGESHEENLKAAPIISGNVWNGEMQSRMKLEIPELKDVGLNQVVGLKYQNMSFSSGEKGVFIQCIFKSSLGEQVTSKAIDICKQEVEAGINDYFNPATFNK